MLDTNIANAYIAILREELVPAMGCTEPIAVAFAAAKTREILGAMPDAIEIYCSANIVKNVKGVTVPNTGGLRGIDAASIAGTISNQPEKKLEVLQSLTDSDRAEIKRLLAAQYCVAHLAEGIEGLFIDARASLKDKSGQVRQSARVVLEKTHTGITRIEKNGEVVYSTEQAYRSTTNKSADKPSCAIQFEQAKNEKSNTIPISYISADRHEYALLNVRDIIAFAESVDLHEISDVLRNQIAMNSAISDEGLRNEYGVSVGKTLLKYRTNDVRVRARARAAAGSDARMAGCAMPVVINSGSGNQGLTVSLPVIEYARELGKDEETLIRALAISNLVALEQKEYIGKLSAYCGAVSAAVGSAAAIAWLQGASYEQIAATITNAIATADGILCDGAKSSCAAKIATALEAALTGMEIGVKEGKSFHNGEGLVGADVEETIRNIGVVGSTGMKPTDVEIIKVMLKQ